MGRIRVSTIIDAPPDQVWEEVRHVERHVDWMADAVEIRFTSPRRSGMGTTFDCLTKVGPIKLTDKMEITDWRDGKLMGVRHVGLVTGTGRFTVTKARGDRSRFTWDERLRFPWWLGGPVGGVVGGRVMRQIWKRNLRVLKALVESGRS
ncbi:MAG: hypothetical protein JWO77_1736 [Ilumatobacteraceae bacterium]|nr:hypothetical protein [Ilumatobacteraceae bacterium]